MRKANISSIAVIILTLSIACPALAATADWIWLEAEKPTSMNIKASPGMTHEYLSGPWLSVMVDADKVEKEVPAEGVLISYDFSVAADGKYEIWNRLGFDSIRTAFEWRIDETDWTTVNHDDPTIDLMELGFWCEVSWMKMGERSLPKGDHTLQIKVLKTKDDKGKPARIVYCSDALCIYAGRFAPNSKYKPGEKWRTQKDVDAAEVVFDLPAPQAPQSRSSVSLEGTWQICRDDELLPGEVAAPVKDLPENPYWKAIDVPGDKNKLRPDLLFAHRLWYRTRVNVPASCAGRSFHIVFPKNNLNTTVFVNGVYCGFDKNPFARVQIDVTKGIKPGLNEIWVGIRDAWYAYSADPQRPMKLRKKFYLPLQYLGEGFQDLAYPIWRHPQSGILAAPELVTAGAGKTTDVFCKPSVDNNELALEVTVSNTRKSDVSGSIICRAVNAETGKVEKTFAPKPFSLKAGGEQVLDIVEKWENPRLWWPDDPQMYRLRVTIEVDEKQLDVSETPFGFRQWTWQGRDFKLNGIPWHGWADCFQAGTKEQWLEFYRETNQRMMRFWGTAWKGMHPEEALTFLDTSGVVCRRSGILDGEAIGYMAIENDPVFKEKYGTEIKMDLLENWKDQMIAQVKGERNHPSVMIWSIENEYLYINCINLYGGLMDKFEAEVKKVSDAVQAIDPTRPTMNDGGGAHKNNAMPVAGDHYVVGSYPQYPALAYTPNTKGGGRGRWQWDQKRPRFIGEDFYITGNNPELSYFGGEQAFQGKAATRPAATIIARMLMEGYRWSNQNAWHFWMGQNDAPGQYVSYAPRAVFCRQWDWTFASAQKAKRTIGIFNDTHYDDPITFAWTLTVGGKPAGGKITEHRIPAGSSEKFDIEIPMPNVDTRQEGQLLLSLSVKGKEVFRDIKAVSVINPDPRRNKVPGLSNLGALDVCVYDPAGRTAEFLKQSAVPFTLAPDLDTLPKKTKILIIGKDALGPEESTSSRLAAFASAGPRVIILEQANPLKYQGLASAQMEAAENEGSTAFAEDLTHPALAGLKQKDFFTWSPGEIVYRSAYLKPARGARSLIQCHENLRCTGLVEIPVGEGLMLITQLLVAEKIDKNVVAQRLLLNLIGCAATYKLEYRPVAAAVKDSPGLAGAMDAVGLKYTVAAGPVETLTSPDAKIAVIAATPANLGQLAGSSDKIEAFTAEGGWIILNGLTPEGLSDYNRIVGIDHMIRPFRRERVTLAPVRHRLASGLTIADVALYSAQRIFPWTQGNYVAGDTFSYIVDYDDVAPFADFPPENYEHPDWNRSNMVNGMVSADAWKYIVNTTAPENGPVDFPLNMPKQVAIREVEWIGNTFYYPVTKVQLIADGHEASAVSFDTKPDNEPQTFAVTPPLKGARFTLRLADWNRLPDKQAVTGLDNIRLIADRPPEFYEKVKPMLNIGGLMAYPKGSGGIVLCNVLFKNAEEVPENLKKKRSILATILRNLKAPFQGGRSIIAGANLRYETIDLAKHANQYRTERGFFGDRSFTFKDIPAGVHKFAGVPFSIYDFPTSPVPTVLMLGGDRIPNDPAKEIRGIGINRKADALFFLHTMRLDARMNDRDRKENKTYETLRYIVTYADGKTENISIFAEIDIAGYRQKQPEAIPGAQIAWTAPFAGTEYSAVAYCKQWNNPRPDIAIKSIDMIYGENPRGVPALIALTAASAE
ncbi:MAG: hypothetical protein JW720_15020 [Sedimentisphaerales bacterium]|nr:hypothetical protein [Sedimentisphaerales bacterium]